MSDKKPIEVPLQMQDWAELIGTVVMMAKATKSFYDALVKEGFTPVQALDIIKARGINML